jgi:AraC-like DNA-binding protein
MHGLFCILCYIYPKKDTYILMNPSIELIMHDEVQKLLDHFSSVLKARVVFYGPDGEIIRSGRQQHNSDYCKMIQEDIFDAERCSMLDAEKQAECLKQKGLVCYQCHAGLKETVAPVLLDSRLLGFVMIGQFRDISAVPAEILRSCHGKNMESKLKSAFAKLPYVSKEQLDGTLGMFMMLVDYIVARELVELKGDWLLEKVEQYLDRHFLEKVKIEEVARFANRSISSLSHLLKKKYGFTFKQMLIEKRLSHADKLLKTRPDLSIGEIAFQSGFNDRFYFSRIYRKYRKMPPGQAR